MVRIASRLGYFAGTIEAPDVCSAKAGPNDRARGLHEPLTIRDMCHRLCAIAVPSTAPIALFWARLAGGPKQGVSSMRYRATILTALILVGGCGSTASPVASPVATASPVPSQDPLSVARLEGVYDVTYTVTAIIGLTLAESGRKVGDKERRVWTATPKCASGPCDTGIQSVTPPSTKNPSAVFTFAAGTYNVSQTVIAADCGRKAFNFAITSSITPSRFVEVGTVVFASELTGTRKAIATPSANARKIGCHGYTFTFGVLAVRRA
jgi:hypothetical protein